MVFNLSIPSIYGEPLNLRIENGDLVYVLGPNGSGKSSLMQHIACSGGNVRWISAHRTNWLQSNNLILSGHDWRNGERGLSGHYQQSNARTTDRIGTSGPNISLYALFNAASNLNAQLADAVRNDDHDETKRLKAIPRPLDVLNRILRRSNIPVQLHHNHEHALIATKNGVSYPADQLSDGERNALLLAADILTVGPGTILLLDEPERHLHTAISSPLLNELFRHRSDCSFIIATHDINLPLNSPSASLLLTRNCSFSKKTPNGWDADFLECSEVIPEQLIRDIIGGRRKVLFVEGEQDSLDLPLYSLIFPNCSVVAKQSCKDVKSAVSSLSKATDLHWLEPYGIVDHDGQTPEQISSLVDSNIYALPVFSIESIYYHPQIQKMISDRMSEIDGVPTDAKLEAAKETLLESLAKDKDRICARTTEHRARAEVLAKLPKHSDILETSAKKTIEVDLAGILSAERSIFDAAHESQDIATLIGRYPIRQTQARGRIANALGFRGYKHYEDAVLKLIEDEKEAREFVKSLFGESYNAINNEPTD